MGKKVLRVLQATGTFGASELVRGGAHYAGKALDPSLPAIPEPELPSMSAAALAGERERGRRRGGRGRRSTIVTGPLGLPAIANTAAKVLTGE